MSDSKTVDLWVGHAMLTSVPQQVINGYDLWMNRNNLFTWNTDSWVFYNMIMGNLEYNSSFYQTKMWYFDLQVLLAEIVSVSIVADYDPWMLITCWTRLALALWNFSTGFFSIN
jgi:hypothetical protein